MCAHCIEQMQKTLSPNRWPFTRRREIRCPVCRSWAKNDEVHLVTTTVQSAHNTRVKVWYFGEGSIALLCHFSVNLRLLYFTYVTFVKWYTLYGVYVRMCLGAQTHTHACTHTQTHTHTHTHKHMYCTYMPVYSTVSNERYVLHVYAYFQYLCT